MCGLHAAQRSFDGSHRLAVACREQLGADRREMRVDLVLSIFEPFPDIFYPDAVQRKVRDRDSPRRRLPRRIGHPPDGGVHRMAFLTLGLTRFGLRMADLQVEEKEEELAPVTW